MKKVENIILLVLSIIAILLGCYISLDKISFNSSIMPENGMIMLLISLGVVSLILSIYNLKFKKK